MLIAWDNEADEATITAVGSELATLPGANVQNAHVAKKWSTAAAVTTSYLVFDMLSSVACQLLAVLGTNLTSAATYRLRASDADSGATSSLLYDSGTVSAGVKDGYGAIYKDAAASTAARYWRLDLTDATLTAGIQVGRVFLGPRWAPSINMQLGAGVTIEDPSNRSKSTGGQMYADVRPQMRVVDFELSFMGQSEMYANAFAMARAQGVVADICVIPDIDSTTLSEDSVWGPMRSVQQLVNHDLQVYRQKFTVEERL